MIQSFSNALKLAVRASDVVARLGSEEFAALLIGADIEQAHRACDRVRREFGTERFSFGDKHVLHVTVSAGSRPSDRRNVSPEICRSFSLERDYVTG
ncbi:diguanylate cyclase [Sphingomonas sp. MJ1 (PH-R8)]|uniref:diguanylate cyclase n=1 Tax=Sphingomonas sp. MJ1 (PH-R8) TaxID=3112950 RepID=UPI003A8A4046